MKVVILAGGLGTRLAEETHTVPKPMVEIGGKPILWHIMSHYSSFGFNEFIIALGYKSEVIKHYFLNFYAMNHDLTIDLRSGSVHYHETQMLRWKVQLVDTGLNTQTGGRVKRLKDWIGDEPFMLTYGDGVSNVNLHDLLRYHRSQGKIATLTAVRPPSRFGNLALGDHDVVSFKEKSNTDAGWINGGFFVMEPSVFDTIENDETTLERGPLEALVRQGQLSAYRHEGFWHMMDTLRDRQLLEEMWQSGHAPWRTESQCLAFGIAA